MALIIDRDDRRIEAGEALPPPLSWFVTGPSLTKCEGTPCLIFLAVPEINCKLNCLKGHVNLRLKVLSGSPAYLAMSTTRKRQPLLPPSCFPI